MKIQNLSLFVIGTLAWSATATQSVKAGNITHIPCNGYVGWKAACGTQRNHPDLVSHPNANEEGLPEDIYIKPANATDNNHQDGNSTAQATVHGDLSTVYHSKWYESSVTPENPAVLTYEFRDVDVIDYVNYVPRGGNGDISEVEVYVRKKGDGDFRFFNRFSWKTDGRTKTVRFRKGLKRSGRAMIPTDRRSKRKARPTNMKS